MTIEPERWGLTEARTERPHRKNTRRHIWWSTTHSKCGSKLFKETADTSIPLCGLCAKSMARLQRSNGWRV